MRFSIIIPAHNTDKWIRKCLDSIRQQSFKDYELIVVCDACTDDTEKIAREYADTVLVVDNHKDGLTRNSGLDIAKGEYIVFVDSDDWLLHEYVLDILNRKIIAESYPDVIAFSFIIKNYMYAYPKGNGGGYWTGAPTKCYKRDFVSDTRFADESLDSDVGFTTRILAKNPRIVDWDMPLYYYNYLRDGSYESKRHGRCQDA